MGWFRSSLTAWRYALRTLVAAYSLVSLLLAIAYLISLEEIFGLEPTLAAKLTFLIRIMAWIGAAFTVLFYTPGKLIEEYKKQTKEKFYRMDPEPSIDRAYRVFHKLHQKGIMLRNGTIELRRDWDEKVREALAEHCSDDCLQMYLMNTGRIDPRTGLQPLPDEKYETALEHITLLLHRDFERDIKWPHS